DVGVLQVLELAAAHAHELEEAAAGVVVLLVRLEVLGEVRDALAEQRDLDLRRAGVALVRGELLDDRRLLDGMKHDVLSGPAVERAAERGRAGLTPEREQRARSGPRPDTQASWGRALYMGRTAGQPGRGWRLSAHATHPQPTTITKQVAGGARTLYRCPPHEFVDPPGRAPRVFVFAPCARAPP